MTTPRQSPYSIYDLDPEVMRLPERGDQAFDAIPLGPSQLDAQKLLQRHDAILLAVDLGEIDALAAMDALLDLVPEQGDVADDVLGLLVHDHLERDEHVREPAGGALADEEVHGGEVVGEELDLAEAVGRDEGLGVREAEVVDPEFLRGRGLVRVVGDVGACEQFGVGGEDLDGLVVVLQGHGRRGTVGAEPDVDEVPRAGDGEDRDHVIPIRIGQYFSLQSASVQRWEESREGIDFNVLTSRHILAQSSSCWRLLAAQLH